MTDETCCGNPLCGRALRLREKLRNNFCGTCYRRWNSRSRPGDGPGPPGKQGGEREEAREARRERAAEAVRLACEGLPVAGVSARMGISKQTIRTYLAEYRANGGVIAVMDLSAAAEKMYEPAVGPPKAPEEPERVTHYNGRDLEPWEADIITQARKDERKRNRALLPPKKVA